MEGTTGHIRQHQKWDHKILCAPDRIRKEVHSTICIGAPEPKQLHLNLIKALDELLVHSKYRGLR